MIDSLNEWSWEAKLTNNTTMDDSLNEWSWEAKLTNNTTMDTKQGCDKKAD